MTTETKSAVGGGTGTAQREKKAGDPRKTGSPGKTGTPAGAVRKVATPWGASAVVDEVKVAQQAGDKRFATVVQLLESTRGETLVRIAYTTDGFTRRGPVTLRARDVERLNAALGTRPLLAEALGRGGDAVGRR